VKAELLLRCRVALPEIGQTGDTDTPAPFTNNNYISMQIKLEKDVGLELRWGEL